MKGTDYKVIDGETYYLSNLIQKLIIYATMFLAVTTMFVIGLLNFIDELNMLREGKTLVFQLSLQQFILSTITAVVSLILSINSIKEVIYTIEDINEYRRS